ncbi:hypothetical protein GCM10020254_28790 [Streptomyces goshikiensis]
MQQPEAPAVPARGADQGDHRQRDESGRDPSVEEEGAEGEGGSRSGAAPPAVPAEGDEVADDDAGEQRERPAHRPAGKEGLTVGQRDDDAGEEQCGGEAHDGVGQHGALSGAARTGFGRAAVRRPGTQESEPSRSHGREFPAEIR